MRKTNQLDSKKKLDLVKKTVRRLTLTEQELKQAAGGTSRTTAPQE